MTIHQTDNLSLWFCFGIFLTSWVCIGALLTFNVNYDILNIKRDIIRLFDTIFLGKRMFAKINGTWCIARGFINKKKKFATATFGPENTHYTLDYYEWHTIDSSLAEWELENKVISLNIKELKAKHPRPDDFERERRMNDRDAYSVAMRHYLRDMEERLDELD